ncbi:hypothetical protein HID58_050525 [Brassica napus]|uniref:D-fructose-1,6-bisphosphate 1-phosphohydrolase n=1 Tax=Brassica napus TaxID=3708 RepID=A0ABQ8A7L9_BRANA|nr:hypothetical protein HID58_050525 [Brassica napus]
MLNYCSDNYIVGFHLLDGSSNINAAVSTGSIFGVYSPSAVNELLSLTFHMATQKRYTMFIMLLIYCCVFLAALGKTSAMYGEFVLTQENIEIPRAGKIYSFNEGNYQMWDESLRKYIDELNLTLVQVGNLTRQEFHVEQGWGKGNSKHMPCLVYYSSLYPKFGCHQTKKVIGIPDRYINGFRFTMEPKKK